MQAAYPVCVSIHETKKKKSRYGHVDNVTTLSASSRFSVCVSTNKAPQHKKKKSWYGHIDNVKVFSASSVSCVCVKIYI